MEDAFKAYIQAKLGNEGGIYGFATCRTWSRRMFEAAPGALINPPPRCGLILLAIFRVLTRPTRLLKNSK